MKNESSRPRRIPARLAALAFLLYSACGVAGTAPAVAVRTMTPRYGEIAQPILAYGVIGTAPGDVASINLPYAARLVQLRVENGQRVARGGALFVAQADPSAVAAASQAATALKLAQGELTRTQALYAQSLATRSQLETARKAALDAQSAFDAQRALGLGGGRVTVAAPADGVVTQIAASPGDRIQAGTPILQLTLRSAGSPNVTLGVDPAAAAQLRAGDPVTVSGLSPSLGRVRAQGRIVVVGAAVDPQTRLVGVNAAVALNDDGLLPGMRVKGEISTRAGRHWIIPRSALLSDSRGEYVYQIGKDRLAHRIDVVKRIENGDDYGVDGALDARQPLVVTGNYELRDGDAVRVETDSPASAQKGAAP